MSLSRSAGPDLAITSSFGSRALVGFGASIMLAIGPVITLSRGLADRL
jgi:hypothetical protein